MSQKELSTYIRIVIVLMSLAAVLTVFFILPNILKWRIEVSTLSENIYSMGMLIAFVALVPIGLSMVGMWKISAEIAKNNSFSYINASTLRRISYYSVAEIIVFLCGMMVLLISGRVDVPLFAMLVVLLLACIFFSVLSAALSHFTFKAAVLKDDNDLTI